MQLENKSIAQNSNRAGEAPAPADIVNIERLMSAFFDRNPDAADPDQRVSFGTSGHRGTSTKASFNEAHILAIAQAVCDYRLKKHISGPIFVGKDTHALSGCAEKTAIEVLAANGISCLIAGGRGFTPTPVVSHAILSYNRKRTGVLADGLIITPSHNPPADGGIKYNPPHGGPADTDVTSWIESRANELLMGNLVGVKRVSLDYAKGSKLVQEWDYVSHYVSELSKILDLDAISKSGLSIGVDPMGGASLDYWAPIADKYKLKLEVVNDQVDPTFGFMPLDHDGKIRMDCSSPFAMRRLLNLKDSFDVAFGNDPDADRHGIVCKSLGLLNPNHYLAVAVQYLLKCRDKWPTQVTIGKTLVSSAVIDRVANSLGRDVSEVPVGFKWFVSGLYSGRMAFAGEESAGASFLRKDGTAWTTDKDGLIMGLLAAEITAVSGKDPGVLFREIAQKFGWPYYTRIDRPIASAKKALLKKLDPAKLTTSMLAGEPIIAKVSRAPGNNAEIGGIKVSTANGWFAARPSGTEDIYKIYAESFLGESHLQEIVEEASKLVLGALDNGEPSPE